MEQAERLRAPTTTQRSAACSDATLQDAVAVHAELCAAAIPSAPPAALA